VNREDKTMRLRDSIAILLLAAITFFSSVIRAADLHAGVEAYFYAPPATANADAICDATLPTKPEDITYALARAMRLYEALEYVHPSGYERRDLNRAMQCLWKVSDRADPRGMVYGAMFAERPEDRNIRMKQAAERGDPEAMWRYATATPVPGQLQIYREWTQKAAIAGHQLAQFRIAATRVDEANQLQQRDPQAITQVADLRQEALRWYEAFALNTNPHGVSCDESVYPKAYFRGLERCSGGFLRGNVKALIAKHYFDGGYGVTQDYGRAAMWFRAAVGDGVYTNGELFAQMLEKGLGVPRDSKLAQEIREKTEQFKRRLVRQSID
jgi:TPR repeat protein